MFTIRHYVFVVVLIFIGKAALASVLVEPYIGYSLGGTSEVKNSTGTTDTDYSGMNIGGRLGAQYLGLMGGLAYDHGSFTSKVTGPASTVSSLNSNGDGLESKWSANSYGVFVGYNLPILFRVWGTYFLSSKWKATETKGGFDKNDEVSASAYELGLGYTALPFLSLNAQYRVYNLDETKYADGSATENNSGSTSKSFILSVSLPINF